MIKGLGRTPFGPRPAAGAGPQSADANSSAPPSPPPMPTPPPPPSAARSREVVKEPAPAEEAYEVLKRHIHMRLVDRLDMNRVSEMDPNTLRS